MKPNEIFEQYAAFKGAMEGTDIPQELKLRVAQEFLQSLPPKAYSASCPATRTWLECAVQSFIDKLTVENGRNQASTQEAGTKEKPARKAKP